MDDKSKLVESLIERATDFGKTSFELAKLKTLDKTSDVVSTIIPNSVVFVFIASFLFFINLGIAFWIGDMLTKTYYGFFIVAAFYAFIAIIFFFFRSLMKQNLYNYIIKQVLK